MLKTIEKAIQDLSPQQFDLMRMALRDNQRMFYATGEQLRTEGLDAAADHYYDLSNAWAYLEAHICDLHNVQLKEVLLTTINKYPSAFKEYLRYTLDKTAQTYNAFHRKARKNEYFSLAAKNERLAKLFRLISSYLATIVE